MGGSLSVVGTHSSGSGEAVPGGSRKIENIGDTNAQAAASANESNDESKKSETVGIASASLKEFDLYDELQQTGCHDVLETLQYCLGDNDRDYRKCQAEVQEFKKCFSISKNGENVLANTRLFDSSKQLKTPRSPV